MENIQIQGESRRALGARRIAQKADGCFPPEADKSGSLLKIKDLGFRSHIYQMGAAVQHHVGEER